MGEGRVDPHAEARQVLALPHFELLKRGPSYNLHMTITTTLSVEYGTCRFTALRSSENAGYSHLIRLPLGTARAVLIL